MLFNFEGSDFFGKKNKNHYLHSAPKSSTILL